ncbi:fungal-specific transcription factor domain-containing protein [Plectosphaerella plurivora]|uniref:Fungal-specific transcription factor domain-containing protein n=1 Tax=Plectosphaerella plurivora TaxID=936078 RepID=A0A9P9ABS3_9PEZI|nr:fungal-specific transcription factor domain-containing protein [Plectosphaerella plurivora]
MRSSPGDFLSTTISAGSHLEDSLRDPVDQVALHSLENNTFSNSIVSPDGQSLLRSLLAEPIRSVSQSTRRADHRSLLDELPYEARAGFPGPDAATRLIDAYFEHCEFFSPVIPSKADFLSAVTPLFTESRRSVDATVTLARFRAYIVFAVAVLLLNRTDSSFPVSRAEGYFAVAVQILAQNSAIICTGDLEHLCNLLLIVQYSCFASNLAAAWQFLGLASRLAVELSLHDERITTGNLSPNLLGQRRWLFWALYTSDRNLCVIIGRPFSIPDEAIQTALPDLPDGNPDRALALHLIKHRLFESEIYTTLHQKMPSNGAALDIFSWREGMRQRLLEWVHAAPVSSVEKSTQLAPLTIFEGILNINLVMLYYPSPSFPNPSEHDMLILARSAAECIRAYKTTFRDGQLRFFWRTTHNLFRSGVAMAYCVHIQSTHSYAGLNQADMIASVNMCVSILWAMVERYPAGRVYRDAFEVLANSVLKSAETSAGDMLPSLGQDSAAFADIDLPQTAVDTLYWGFGLLS